GAHTRLRAPLGNTPIDVPPPPPPGAPGRAGGAAAPAPAPVSEGPGRDQYGIVHGAKVSNDGLVYVADRANRRIQVFSLEGKYLTQGFVNRATSNNSCGTVAFSPDPQQEFIYCPDFNKGEIAIVRIKTLETVAAFGSGGSGPGHFQNRHGMVIVSKGNLYHPGVTPRG